MQHFPIFLDLADQRVVLSGDGEVALAKLRLLLAWPPPISARSATSSPARAWNTARWPRRARSPWRSARRVRLSCRPIAAYLAQREAGEAFLQTYRRIGMGPFKSALYDNADKDRANAA